MCQSDITTKEELFAAVERMLAHYGNIVGPLGHSIFVHLLNMKSSLKSGNFDVAAWHLTEAAEREWMFPPGRLPHWPPIHVFRKDLWAEGEAESVAIRFRAIMRGGA